MSFFDSSRGIVDYCLECCGREKDCGAARLAIGFAECSKQIDTKALRQALVQFASSEQQQKLLSELMQKVFASKRPEMKEGEDLEAFHKRLEADEETYKQEIAYSSDIWSSLAAKANFNALIGDFIAGLLQHLAETQALKNPQFHPWCLCHPTYLRLAALVQTIAAVVATRQIEQPLYYCALGAGDLWQESFLLEAFKRVGFQDVRATFVDIIYEGDLLRPGDFEYDQMLKQSFQEQKERIAYLMAQYPKWEITTYQYLSDIVQKSMRDKQQFHLMTLIDPNAPDVFLTWEDRPTHYHLDDALLQRTYHFLDFEIIQRRFGYHYSGFHNCMLFDHVPSGSEEFDRRGPFERFRGVFIVPQSAHLQPYLFYHGDCQLSQNCRALSNRLTQPNAPRSFGAYMSMTTGSGAEVESLLQEPFEFRDSAYVRFVDAIEALLAPQSVIAYTQPLDWDEPPADLIKVTVIKNAARKKEVTASIYGETMKLLGAVQLYSESEAVAEEKEEKKEEAVAAQPYYTQIFPS